MIKRVEQLAGRHLGVQRAQRLDRLELEHDGLGGRQLALEDLGLPLDDEDRRACDAAWYALPRRRPEENR